MNRLFSKQEVVKKRNLLNPKLNVQGAKEHTLLDQVAPMDWIPKNYQHYLKDICEKQKSDFPRKKTIH